MTSEELRVIVAHPFLALAREFGWDDRQLAAAKKLIDITVIRIETSRVEPSLPDPCAICGARWSCAHGHALHRGAGGESASRTEPEGGHELIVPPTTAGGNETVVREGIYMSRKPFSELRAQMSPESQARAAARTAAMSAELSAQIAPAGPETAAPRDRKCIIGEYCRLHGFIHGAEAEELRERVEKLAKEFAEEDANIASRALRDMLEDVDARDSCAFLEAKSPPALSGAASQSRQMASKVFERGCMEQGDQTFSCQQHESRSPDGDGHPIAKGLGDERAEPPGRGEQVATVITPQQARVHAREGTERNDAAPLKPAAGSEPADSHSQPSAASTADRPQEK